MKSNARTAISTRNQRGAALVTSILVLLLITVLAMTLTFIGNESLIISTNDRRNTQAFYIAQAGASHAANIIINSDSSQFGNILAAGDQQSNTGDELSVQPMGYSGPPFVAIPSGGVDTSGAPVIEPALPGYTYISGNDILFTGSGGTVNNPGLIYAANQLRVTGSAGFYGLMVIANVNDIADAGGTNLLRLDSNGVLTMTGSPTVTYNGGGPLGSLKVLGWREVRN